MRSGRLEILWSDDDYVAVFKPAGLTTIPGRGEAESVLEHLSEQVGLPASGAEDPRLRVVHRLDKDTSGVLVFAKSKDAQRHLSHQFQNNLVEKEYLALVAGRPVESEGEIDAPLAPHPTSPQKMAVVRHGGRPARTLWKAEELFRSYALLRVFPKTGKTHQIRVHLAHIGLPLAIDPLYHPGTAGGIFLSSFKRGYRPSGGTRETADRAADAARREAPVYQSRRTTGFAPGASAQGFARGAQCAAEIRLALSPHCVFGQGLAEISTAAPLPEAMTR